MSPRCHLDGCDGAVLPELPFCPRHWRLCPAPLQHALWRLWYPAHGIAGRLSAACVEAMQQAVAAIRAGEGTP
jgi:hypothetical protein